MSIPKLSDYQFSKPLSDYPNKPGWRIEPGRSVLLIHDMQRYFVGFYGESSQTIAQLKSQIIRLKAWANEQGVPCVYTAQPGDQAPGDRALLTDFWGEGLAEDKALTGIVDDLTPGPDDIVFTKWRYSAFKKNNFENWLQATGRDQIIICGVYANIGIMATALDAFMSDYQAFVVADAVADFSAHEHELALNFVAKRCGVVTDVAAVQGARSAEAAAIAEATTNDSVNESPLTYLAMHQHVAEVLSIELDDVDPFENLEDLGLDSIRLMSLLERWQAMGVMFDFSAVAENLTINHWWSLLSSGDAALQAGEEAVA